MGRQFNCRPNRRTPHHFGVRIRIWKIYYKYYDNCGNMIINIFYMQYRKTHF